MLCIACRRFFFAFDESTIGNSQPHFTRALVATRDKVTNAAVDKLYVALGGKLCLEGLPTTEA
jgi:hypothetical protein